MSIYKRDTIRVHGKAFRREYLERERICFPDVLSNGDMYFLWLAFHLTDDIVWTEGNFYTWKYNPLSLTRSIPRYNAQRYDRALKCYSALAHNLMGRGRYDFARQVVMVNIEAAYRVVHSRSLRHMAKENADNVLAAIFSFVKEFGEMYIQHSNNHKITDWVAEIGTSAGI